jgi:hypothetical protein
MPSPRLNRHALLSPSVKRPREHSRLRDPWLPGSYPVEDLKALKLKLCTYTVEEKKNKLHTHTHRFLS